MRIIYLAIIVFTALSTYAQQKPVALYPNGVPNSKPAPADYAEITDKGWIGKVTVPTIIPYLPEKSKANGAAVIICPGGAYAGLAADHEGKAVAEAFTKIGVTAFVLKYRLPNDAIMVNKSIGPLQDAQRALQLVREHANEWGINPAKVGIIGFSAGGHLASTAATHFNNAVIDNPGSTSLRPDFAILVYPVISMSPIGHQYSKEMLLGKNPSQQMIDFYSNEKQVTANTPPTFLTHATDDNGVPVQNSVMFYDALVKHKVKAEMHLYQEGGHGYGLNNPKSRDPWFERLKHWMDANGWL
ncbi:alpha/beta hydrolase [Mucilaginibacter hurinus]|uniref:Alpha/beta hydrolase n=1 Tax=Mucilaginibacter hurinus TaxID=2201324 RepID=A0A367GP18_9SPHI|nr:alpha/beta hydrolase [Mucilaginibacter hurinus]RCH54808.1 alpha/beta hydrolase [Mucilaginibacter hurinus]